MTVYGSTLDPGFQFADPFTGSATFTIDPASGGTPVTVLNTGPNGAKVATYNGANATYAAQSFVTTPGVHTVVITNGASARTEPICWDRLDTRHLGSLRRRPCGSPG